MERNTADQRQSIEAIRAGAAAISQLLAEGALQDEAWDRAARLLIRCRTARKALERTSGHMLRSHTRG